MEKDTVGKLCLDTLEEGYSWGKDKVEEAYSGGKDKIGKEYRYLEKIKLGKYLLRKGHS